MKCPHCEKELEIEERVFNNLASYGGFAVAATVCCQRPTMVRRKLSYTVEAYPTDRKADDWGIEFKK